MQSLAVEGFTAEQTIAALHAPGRTIDFRYELLDNNNIRIRDLSTMLAASVNNSSFAEIKRIAKFKMVDDPEVDWLRDRIRPWFRLKMTSAWAEWPLGTFLLSTPKKQIKDTHDERNIDAYDLGLVLRDDKVETRYTVAAGTNVVTAVLTVLTGAGLTTANITPTTETLPVALEWKAGTTKYKIVADLLASINYGSLYFSALGVPTARPYQRPDQRGTEYTYAADASSLLHPDIEVGLDLFSIPNKWLAIVSEPDRAALSSVYTNTNPLSPTSTVSRGRTILALLESQEATSQAMLDAKVQKAAFDASQVYETINFKTALMPHHEDFDLIAIDYSRVGTGVRRFVEHSWSMNLKVGQLMTHELRRVVTV